MMLTRTGEGHQQKFLLDFCVRMVMWEEAFQLQLVCTLLVAVLRAWGTMQIELDRMLQEKRENCR